MVTIHLFLQVSSALAFHPGAIYILVLLRQHFWWFFMEDTKGFIAACQICPQHKCTHQVPSGLLPASSSSSYFPLFFRIPLLAYYPLPVTQSYIQQLIGVPNPFKSFRSKSNPNKFSNPTTPFPVQPPVSHLSNVPGVANYHSSLNGNPLSPGFCPAMDFDAGPSAFVCSSKCYQ